MVPFFSSGARVNTKDSKWMTPLHRACASGSVVCSLTLYTLRVISILFLLTVSLLN